MKNIQICPDSHGKRFEIFLFLLGDITVLPPLDAGPGFLKGPEISRMVRSLTDPVFLCEEFFELRSVAGSCSWNEHSLFIY